MKRLSGLFIVLVLVGASAFAQSGAPEGFFAFQREIPMISVTASAVQEIVKIDTFVVSGFSKGGSDDLPASVVAELHRIFKTQKHGQVDYLQGWADTTRWVRDRFAPKEDYANDWKTAKARTQFAAMLGIEDGAQVSCVDPMLKMPQRAIVILRATYVPRTFGGNAPIGSLIILTDDEEVRSPISVRMEEFDPSTGAPIPGAVREFKVYKSFRFDAPHGHYKLIAREENFETVRTVVRADSAEKHSVLLDLHSIPVEKENPFDGVRLALSVGALTFFTNSDGAIGAPCASLSFEGQSASLGYTFGAIGIERPGVDGKRALIVQSVELTLYPTEILGFTAGYAWSNEIALNSDNALKSWAGPEAGVKLRFQHILTDRLAISVGANASYLKFIETGNNDVAWRIGGTAALKLTYSF
jgi:hypothetical protein